jgi:hypothetical protein
MMEEINNTNKNTSESISHQSQDSFSKMIWKEGPHGTWYLAKREYQTTDTNTIDEPEFINFDLVNEDKPDEEKTFNENEKVIVDSKMHTIASMENDEIFIKLTDDSEKFPTTKDLINKFLNFNILIVGKTKTYLLEKIKLNINDDFSYLKGLLAEYLSIPKDILIINYNTKEISETDKIFSLPELKEGDTFVIGFVKNQELFFQRSSSKDYSWYDRKNLIPFVVDKNIIITAVGFFRHYESNMPAIYDFFLYEIDINGSKKLINSLSNVTVNANECDAYYVKKVTISPTHIKANVKYYAYIYYKGNNEMRTYYVYNGNNEVIVNGIKIRFFDAFQSDHKCSTTTGHLPYIYFKFDNPYSE